VAASAIKSLDIAPWRSWDLPKSFSSDKTKYRIRPLVARTSQIYRDRDGKAIPRVAMASNPVAVIEELLY
jgi:hypothetical protein